MNRLLHVLMGLLCILALPATLVLAQDDCPTGATCYEGHELEFDAQDGPVQFLVVETTAHTVETLDSEMTSETVVLVEFVSNGDSFEQRGQPLPPYPKVGRLATAEVWDTFSLAEVSGAN